MPNESDVRAKALMAEVDALAADLAHALGIADDDVDDLLAATLGVEPVARPDITERARAMTEAVLPRLQSRLATLWPLLRQAVTASDLVALGLAPAARAQAGAGFLGTDNDTRQIVQVASLFAWAELETLTRGAPGKEEFLTAARSRRVNDQLSSKAYEVFLAAI